MEGDWPRECPLIYFTNLYRTPGTAEETVKEAGKIGKETERLAWGQLLYGRGEMAEAARVLRECMKQPVTFQKRIGIGITLGACAMYLGDVRLWREGKQYIFESECKNDEEKEIVKFYMATMNSTLFSNEGFPEAFQKGCFDLYPNDSIPLIRTFYAKFLMLRANDVYLKEGAKQHVLFLSYLPYAIEPLISQTKKEKNIIVELYLQLICATVYHNIGKNQEAIQHLDRAIELALPDKVYAILSEYRRPLDFLMDECLKLVDMNALKKVRTIQKQLMTGWTKLHNELVLNKTPNLLTARESEVAKWAICGLTNKEIAEHLNISYESVKQAMKHVLQKTGAKNRRELAHFFF